MLKIKDRLWLLIFWLSGLILVFILLAILGYLLFKGHQVLSYEFLTTSPKGLYLGSEGGILPAIKGSLSLVALAVTTVTLPALLTALYLAEYSNTSFFSKYITLIIQCMVGIPSILTGLFGYAFFVVYLKLGISLIAGGLTLGIMVFPTLVVLMRDALTSVNQEYRLVGLALGVSRWYIIKRLILPNACPGILSAILLAMGYAAGATAPIMVTACTIMSKGSISLFNPVMALPYHLYILFSQHISIEKAYGTALLLVMLLLLLNMTAVYLRSIIQKEHKLL